MIKKKENDEEMKMTKDEVKRRTKSKEVAPKLNLLKERKQWSYFLGKT